MDKIRTYLGDKAFWKITLTLALPIALQNLLTSSLTLVDTIMVGQLGDVYLSSVGMAGQWSWLMSLFLFGTCSGLSVLVSQYWGVGDEKRIKKVMGLALVITILFSVIFAAVGFVSPQTVIGIFNKTPAVIKAGSDYLKIAVLSYPALALNLCLSAVLRSTEEVKIPMYSAFISTVLNCFMNYSLIFGKFGFPEMGIKGAAVATCISSWAGVLFIIIISAVKKKIIIGGIKDVFSFEKEIFSLFMQKASPVILNETIWSLGTFLINVMYGHLGYEKYAAITILKTFNDISYVFFIGLCNACCVIVGKHIGAGELEKGYVDARRFAVNIPLISVGVGALIVVFRYQLVNLFNLSGNLTPLTQSCAVGIMLAVGIELTLKNVGYIQIVGILRSGGDTMTGMKYDISSLWLLSVPLTYLAAFVFKLPFVAVYVIMLLSEDLPKAILCVRRFVSKKWIMPVTDEGKNALKNG